MRIEFKKHINSNEEREVDIIIYGTEEQVEGMFDRLSNDYSIDYSMDTFDGECAIGTLEFERGSMTEIKSEITEDYKRYKKLNGWR